MAIINGGKVRSVGMNLTAGSANTVYTCPPNHTAKVELMFVCNRGSGNKTVSIQWHDTSSSGAYYIVGGYVVSAYSYLMLSGAYLALNAGDHIVVTPEAGSTMDVTVSVEEYYDPASNQ